MLVVHINNVLRLLQKQMELMQITTSLHALYLPLHDADGGSSSTERVRIDSSGNMGLGTSPTDHNSFTRIFDVNGSGGGAVYCRTNGSSSNVAIFGQSGSDVYIINKTAGNTRFNVSDAEKMRLDNGTTDANHDD